MERNKQKKIGRLKKFVRFCSSSAGPRQINQAEKRENCERELFWQSKHTRLNTQFRAFCFCLFNVDYFQLLMVPASVHQLTHSLALSRVLLIFGILIILSHHSGLISFSFYGLLLKCGNLPSKRMTTYKVRAWWWFFLLLFSFAMLSLNKHINKIADQ